MARVDIDTIVKRYRKFVNKFGRTFLSSLDNQSLPEYSATRKASSELNALSAYTKEQLTRLLIRAYMDEQKKVRGYLRSQGVKRKRDDIVRFKRINESTLNILLNDPFTGSIPLITKQLFNLKGRIRSIEMQARGLLNGTLMENALPETNLFTSISLASFIKIPTKRGPRHVRLDKFMRQLLNDAVSKARAVGMRNKMLEHGEEYIILRNPGGDDGAKGVYSNKVFALSKRAADELGVPHVSALPNGGVPMHPNSKMIESPWVKSIELKKEQKIEAPPEWALHRSFESVRMEYQKRVG